MGNPLNENCRLCLDMINSENFEEVSNVTKEILDILLLKLDINKSKHVICKVCAEKVQEALKFKMMCISTDNLIISYVDDETGSSVDLLEIYAKKRGDKQLVNTLQDHKVCRLCMQLIPGESISVYEIKLDAIEKYIPEVNISVIENPVVCKQCFDSVDTHSTFLKNCLKVEQKIKSYRGDSDSHSSSMLSISELRTEDCTGESIIKQENHENDDECMESKFSLEPLREDGEYEIKTECIDIKSEEDDQSGTIPVSCHTPLMLIQEEHAYARNFKIQEEHAYARNFKTVCRRSLKWHQLQHEDPPQVQMYKCDKCSFASKYRHNLKTHQLRYMDSSQVETYKCETCGYTSKHRNLFERHHLVHKVYKCGKCSYKARYRCQLTQHELVHKDPSEVQMYKCDKCSYESKYKSTLEMHQLRHKDPSQVRMYKCDMCGYKTRRKATLNIHQFTVHRHKLPSQAHVYKCDKCDFKTKYDPNFAQHLRTHTDPSKEEIYWCDECSFVTKDGNGFEEHQLIHGSSLQVQMYKCDKCSYVSRYRSSFEDHQLIHKDPSQVQMYRTYSRR